MYGGTYLGRVEGHQAGGQGGDLLRRGQRAGVAVHHLRGHALQHLHVLFHHGPRRDGVLELVHRG